ncbi:hypothetical protein [Psychrobacter raelei]|uniref:hypothetical protein n=1 Tax=Psychrobacter raelei TaxID=2565531 RepID=UPI003F6380DE
MRKRFLMLASLLAVGCTTKPIVAPVENTEVIYPIQKIIASAQKTSIFRYYTDPTTQAQAMASVEGVFKWQKGCLYLIQKDGSYMTAMFPKYPENAVKWNEYNRTLSLNGYIFKMGDYISTNGQYSKYYPDNDIEEYAQQGDARCLTPILVEIGTIDLKK